MKNYKSFSQAKQDQYVLNKLYSNDIYCVDKLLNGDDYYYIEIGAQHPIIINNTFLLEVLGWSGFSFDLDLDPEWCTFRSNPLIQCNAIDFDFRQFFADNNVPKCIDYLSLDIDLGTLDCLKRLPLDEYTFKVVTLEHDEYAHGVDYKMAMREIMLSHGYKLDVPDVTNEGNSFEDWWIHE